jgi:hypothetical protein
MTLNDAGDGIDLEPPNTCARCGKLCITSAERLSPTAEMQWVCDQCVEEAPEVFASPEGWIARIKAEAVTLAASLTEEQKRQMILDPDSFFNPRKGKP